MLIVDVETTGLDPKKHSILSIGAVDFHHPQNQFYQECRVWDDAEIDPAALAVNGFTEEQVRDPHKKSVKELIEEFSVWMQEKQTRVLAGHNASFDLGFVNISAERYGLKRLFDRRSVDLHSLCYAHMLRCRSNPCREKHSFLTLDAVLGYVGLPLEPKPHHALMGAKLEAESFSRLIYGRQLLLEFAEYKIPEYIS